MRKLIYNPPCLRMTEFAIEKGFALSDGTCFEDWKQGEEF